MGKILRQPKLWITLASLAFIAVALAQQAGQLRQQSLVANGWWWLTLGLGLTWLSILTNGLAWRELLVWLRHPPDGLAVVPLFVRSNLLKYLPGGLASGGAGPGAPTGHWRWPGSGWCDS